jgi:hypothetical protein
MMVTWDEASKCPKCTKYGEKTGEKKSVDTKAVPLTVVTLHCRNPLCSWCNTPWYVSVYLDGSIMQPQGGREKQYEMPDGGRMAVDKRIEDVNAYAAQDLTQPGLEIHKR